MFKLNKVKFFQSFFFIKVLEQKLEIFKVKHLVLSLLELELRILLNSTLSHVNKNSRITKIFLKKNLKLGSKQEFYLALISILITVKVDLPII